MAEHIYNVEIEDLIWSNTKHNFEALLLQTRITYMGHRIVKGSKSSEEVRRMNYNKLTPEQEKVIVHKSTEYPID